MLMQNGCCCGITCGTTVVYPQASAQLESDFYYALNTPSNQTFYNPVTGLTMKYTDTTGNLGPLDAVGIVWIKSISTCDWQNLRYGFDELRNFIRRGHTVMITIEVAGCFTSADKTMVDGWLSELGASDIGMIRANIMYGCQVITNYAPSNGLNTSMSTWRLGGSSELTITGDAVEVVTNADGKILVAGVVSTITGNSNNGKVLVLGDENMTDCPGTSTTMQKLYDNVCEIIGEPI